MIGLTVLSQQEADASFGGYNCPKSKRELQRETRKYLKKSQKDASRYTKWFYESTCNKNLK